MSCSHGSSEMFQNIVLNQASMHLMRHILGSYALTVVGLPKTIDNDVYPIKLSLGASTAAEQGAIFFKNVVNEASANPRMLIIHEVRNSFVRNFLGMLE